MSSLELAHATHRATCGDIMAVGIAEEKFCIDSAVREFQIYKEFRDCLVLFSQANLLSMYQGILICSLLYTVGLAVQD